MKIALIERSICEIIQGICISAGLSCHLVDEGYVSLNCERSFHWVLIVMGLKERCIRMYNSLKGHDDHEIEIKDFAGMLSTYLSIYNFFEKKECTEWSLLKAFKENTDQHTFDIKFADGIV
ncbi:hypothetical protein FXO38_21062 [Capsicum annuum]|nr:hypothetical protein FXO38_21062 [Capsicum annuum]